MLSIRKQQIKAWEDMSKLEMQVSCKFLPIEFYQLQQFLAPFSYVPMQKGATETEFKNRHYKSIQERKRVWLDIALHIHEIRLQAYERQFQDHYQRLDVSFSAAHASTMNKLDEYVMIQTRRWKQEVYDRMFTFRILLLQNRQRSSIGKMTIGVSPEPYLDLDCNPFDKHEWTQLSLGNRGCFREPSSQFSFVQGPAFIRLNQTALRTEEQQRAEIKREYEEISKKVTNHLIEKPHFVSLSSPYFKQYALELRNYFNCCYFSTPISYKDQVEALQQINHHSSIRQKLKQKDLIIRVTDKGHNFYIGSRVEFEKKGEQFFQETNAFKELTSNPFHEIKSRVIDLLNRLRTNGSISKTQYEAMAPDSKKCELAHLYFNPKTHKVGISLFVCSVLSLVVHTMYRSLGGYTSAADRKYYSRSHDQHFQSSRQIDTTYFQSKMP